MPYSKISEANVKKLDGVALSLAQANKIAKMADAIGGEYAWPTAIKNFKRNHSIDDGKWVSGKAKDKEIHEIIVEKEDDGYRIIGVSTAAVKDREDEIFTTDAMDFDIASAKETGVYPEFRMWHKKYLAVGKVTKMSRVGIFAIDEGYAYDDPFSKEVCEKILSDNDGHWRMSRGFYVLEASGGCPSCGEGLVIETKHMIAGFSCPTCKSIHSRYKGTLDDVKFRKTKTYDVTITDIPCVPMTGVSAFRVDNTEAIMTKKELRKKLLDAGLDPKTVDERLKEIDAEQLKALDTLPQAEVLKELDLEEVSDDDGEELFVLDPEVLKDFAGIVKEQVTESLDLEPIIEKAVKEAIDGLEIDLGDVQVEGIEGISELIETVAELKETVAVMAQSDDERLAQLLEDSPRGGKLRILRAKGGKKKKKVDEDEDEDEEEEEEEEFLEEKDIREGVIVGADGRVAKSMTEFITGGEVT
jgi:hypothetical protein